MDEITQEQLETMTKNVGKRQAKLALKDGEPLNIRVAEVHRFKQKVGGKDKKKDKAVISLLIDQIDGETPDTGVCEFVATSPRLVALMVSHINEAVGKTFVLGYKLKENGKTREWGFSQASN